MTEATDVPEPDGVHYQPDELSSDRGQLVADVVTDGRRGRSDRSGSPASLDSARRAAVPLDRFHKPDPDATDRRTPPTPTTT